MSDDVCIPTIADHGPSRPLRELYFELGRAWLDHGQYMKATEAFEQSLKHEGSTLAYWEIRFYSALALQKAGENEQAFHAYLEATTEAPERVGDILPYAHELLTRHTATAEGERLLHRWADEIERTNLSADDRAKVTFFLGRISLYLEDYARAFEFYRDTEQVLPHDARVVEGLGETLWRTGRLEQAIETLNRAHELAEQGSHPERLAAINTRIINVLVDSDQYEEALSRIEYWLGQDDGYTYDLLLSRSRCYLALSRTEEALKAAEAAFEQKSTTVQAHLLRAQALIALERYPEAVSATDQALRNSPTNREALLYKAQALIEGQIDLDQGQRMLKRYVEHTMADKTAVYQVLSPAFATRTADGNFHYFLAQLCHVLGDSAEALREVEQALELGLSAGEYPEAPAEQLKAELLDAEEEWEEAAEWFLEAGRHFSLRGEYEIAIDLLTRAKELNQDHAAAYWYLAEALRMHSYRSDPPYIDVEEVSSNRTISIWKSGTEIELPSVDDSWAYVSRALMSEQQTLLPDVDYRRELWWEAIAYLERAILLDDSDTFCWASLGRNHRSLENESNAIQATGEALHRDPEDSSNLEERIAILADTGQFAEAEEAINKLRTLETTRNVWVDAVEAYILLRMGEYNSALNLTNNAIEAEPHNIWYRILRGQCYKALKEPDSAVEDYGYIWSRYDPSNKGDQAYFGWAAYECGEIEEAIAILGEMCDKPTTDVGTACSRLGICYLAQGDLMRAKEKLNKGIQAMISGPRLDDLLNFDLRDIEASSLNWPHGAQVREIVDWAKENIRERKLELERRPSAVEELSQVVAELKSRGDTNGWPWISASAGLARLRGGSGQWMEAGSIYQSLLKDPDRFPEARIGLENTITTMQQEGERHLHGGSPDRAQEQFKKALSLALEVMNDQQGIAADLQSRLGYACFELGDVVQARENFAQAVKLYKQAGLSNPGGNLGAVCRSLLLDVARYWNLESEWKLWAEVAGLPEDLKTDLLAAREALEEYLDELYQLSEQVGDLKIPLVTPIVLELGEGLIPEDTGPEWSLFKTYIPEMRMRIENQMGVQVPGIRVRHGDLPPDGYLIMLDEIQHSTGSVDLTKRYCPRPPDALRRWGIDERSLIQAPNPLTGEPGCWVQPSDWNSVPDFELWAEPLVFVVYHLEAVLRSNLVDFLGLQEVEELLEQWKQDEQGSSLIDAALPDQASRLHFARLLRGLLREYVPITAWKDILEVVGASGLASDNVGEIIRDVRLRLKELLPGNDVTTKHIELPPQLEYTAASWLRHENGKVYFDPLPMESHELMTAIRDLVHTSDRNLALVTRSSELRPFLRRMVEFEFPYLMVLSRDELLSLDELVENHGRGRQDESVDTDG